MTFFIIDLTSYITSIKIEKLMKISAFAILLSSTILNVCLSQSQEITIASTSKIEIDASDVSEVITLENEERDEYRVVIDDGNLQYATDVVPIKAYLIFHSSQEMPHFETAFDLGSFYSIRGVQMGKDNLSIRAITMSLDGTRQLLEIDLSEIKSFIGATEEGEVAEGYFPSSVTLTKTELK